MYFPCSLSSLRRAGESFSLGRGLAEPVNEFETLAS